MAVKLPTHEEATERVVTNSASPLDIFVYENEPAGIDESEKFRTELQNLLNSIGRYYIEAGWNEGRSSFAAEIGADLDDEEKPHKNLSSYLTAVFG